jgi:predicted transcriptional regulator
MFQENLGLTLKEFGIQQRWLGNIAQTGESALSKYLDGSRDSKSSTLAKWLKALPLEVQRRFYEKCLSDIVTPQANLVTLVEKLDPASQEDREKAATVLVLIGKFYKKQSELRENAEPVEQKELLRSI